MKTIKTILDTRLIGLEDRFVEYLRRPTHANLILIAAQIAEIKAEFNLDAERKYRWKEVLRMYRYNTNITRKEGKENHFSAGEEEDFFKMKIKE